MAKNKTGTWSIVQHAREIARLQQKYGAADLEARTNVNFAVCIHDLIVCVVSLALTDDYLLQVDRTPPAGPEDTA